MPKLAIVLGALAVFFTVMDFASGNVMEQTPAAFGVVMFILGFFALTNNPKKRAMYMHTEAVLALLGFLSTVWWLVDYIRMILGHPYANQGAVIEHALASLTYLLFLLLCIRSFVNSRQKRAQAERAARE